MNEGIDNLAAARFLEDPEPVLQLQLAMEGAGEWARWTLDRQLWYLRVRARMSQGELAWRSGVSQARISRLEAGADMKLSTLRALWAGLGWQPLVVPEPLGTLREGRPGRSLRAPEADMSPRR